MKIIGIIPARYDSTRFPGKPLAEIAGRSMIERVYRQAALCTSLHKVLVATDDIRIAEHVEGFGGNVILTRKDHVSGTDRCAEALEKEGGNWDAVINIQGDEPFIQPQQIELLCNCFHRQDTQIATLVKIIRSTDELENENSPKVVLANNGEALLFSRQIIPFVKGIPKSDWLQVQTFYKHIGIYGFRVSVLKKLTKLAQSDLEKAESLEQLRWLGYGYRIMTSITDQETIAVDTPSDLERIQVQYFRGDV